MCWFKLQLPTINSDVYGAKGNSGDMVIKVEDTDDRRKEASHNDDDVTSTTRES